MKDLGLVTEMNGGNFIWCYFSDLFKNLYITYFLLKDFFKSKTTGAQGVRDISKIKGTLLLKDVSQQH